jgi:hypothetical protein
LKSTAVARPMPPARRLNRYATLLGRSAQKAEGCKFAPG